MFKNKTIGHLFFYFLWRLNFYGLPEVVKLKDLATRVKNIGHELRLLAHELKIWPHELRIWRTS